MADTPPPSRKTKMEGLREKFAIFDLNDDGVVNVSDVLILLGAFGMVCD